VSDAFAMAVLTCMAMGDFKGALAFARREAADSHLEGLPHFAACHLIQPLVMLGEFDEALQFADIMEEGWHTSGRPAAGWMAPSFYAVALVHAFEGNDAEYAKWLAMADEVGLNSRSAYRGFFLGRIALHRGEYDTAARPVDPEATSWDGGHYYWLAVTLDAAAAQHAPDLDERLAAANALESENAYLAACAARARAHHAGDGAGLQAAAAMFDALGATFERTWTLSLRSA
jgi:hypothetical protein